MADIASTDITVTILNKRRVEGRTFAVCRLQFGDGALTYGSGGIPLPSGKFGCPNSLESVRVIDSGTTGYSWSWDRTNNKLRAFQSAIHTHALHLNNADVADGATTRVNAGTNLLGANTGSDIAVAGVAGTTGAGGIVQAAGAVLTEFPSSTALAAQDLKIETVGW